MYSVRAEMALYSFLIPQHPACAHSAGAPFMFAERKLKFSSFVSQPRNLQGRLSWLSQGLVP